MKKMISLLSIMAMLSSFAWQTQAQGAASPIRIYMDGIRLSTDQAPIEKQGRVLLPLRAIFEALDASVDWNSKTGVVRAEKGNTTVTLKIGSKTATINNKKVTLDVPAQTVKGRTLVPVRFVSTALGAKVDWKSSARSVYITNGDQPPVDDPSTISPVTYVTPQIVSQYGDGRDLNVSFSKPSNESLVSHYRVLVVKSDKARWFDETAAKQVSSSNYAFVGIQGSDRSVNLTAQTRDTDGELLRSGVSYNVYVLAAGKQGQFALSNASPAVTLGAGTSASGVKGTDTADYGDGRDLTVSFTKAQNESNIANYRVFVVKTQNAGSFNLSTANGMSSSNYTTVNKTGASTLTTTLSSSARDTSGELIRNGVSYTIYVLAVSSNTSVSPSQLSAGSSAITLGSGTVTVPYITAVNDVSDYGDGRDVKISFNKVSDESRISGYRVYAVRDQNASSFTLSSADALSSSNYTSISKNGYNISQTLNSGSRDVNGYLITTGTTYRFFVVAVGANGYSNTISSVSSALTLWNNSNINAVTNVSVDDVNDYNDGRDLRVAFTRASNESNISHYRILVVRNNNAGNFDLYDANRVSSANYTYVSKTGYNINQVLPSDARDVDGYAIRNGISYRVFVLSVGSGSYSGTNALSSYSPAITLSDKNNVSAVTGVSASDVGNNNNGSDLKVTFNRVSDESTIAHYRVYVVNNAYAGSFRLSDAVANSYYNVVSKTGYNLSQVLSASTRDTNGNLIQNGVAYRIFVLSVGGGYYSGSNALSAASSVITLTNTGSVGAVSNVSAADIKDNGDGRDLRVTFDRAADESGISEYRIYVVKDQYAGNFTKSEAVASSYYTSVAKTGGAVTKDLTSGTKDTDGNTIRNGMKYRVFVLSVGSGASALSPGSAPITLADNSRVAPATGVTGEMYLDGTGKAAGVLVRFGPSATPSIVKEYRVFVVPSSSGFNLNEANNNVYFTKNSDGELRIPLTSNSTQGSPISAGKYRVYVLAVSNSSDIPNALSEPSAEFTVQDQPTAQPVAAVTKVTAVYKNANELDVSYADPKDANIASYTIALVASDIEVTASNVEDKAVTQAKDVNGTTGTLNVAGVKGGTYKVYVLSKAIDKNTKVNALSAPSGSITVPNQ
ncbi:copper amine oxidase N-terminal domain-containing protein [Paenibacillus sp. J22TS3]|uniref:copper amine oxidase N-terminal domain-containing protein n=1 Tax=Paenibacillus sp. J22TS3 TaxID=2807192 RepID=UPI001B18B417|nr:copper amine oxidase N-terminal domain-containing protein [Paenibacillus sp. J22TS3]GIP24258.1 hypothetical protein J22TS3_45330 [Paenibacillus sp. J22TS3]